MSKTEQLKRHTFIDGIIWFKSCAACSMASSPSTIYPLQMVTCRPCHSKDMALSGLVTLTFDLLTLELVRNVSRGTDFFLPILVFLRLFISELWVMGKQASDWQYDLITLTCDLWRHRACRWCSSSYSIPVPSLKFVGLPLGRYGAYCVSALIGLETSTFDFSTSMWDHESPVSWGSFLSISAC